MSSKYPLIRKKKTKLSKHPEWIFKRRKKNPKHFLIYLFTKILCTVYWDWNVFACFIVGGICVSLLAVTKRILRLDTEWLILTEIQFIFHACIVLMHALHTYTHRHNGNEFTKILNPIWEKEQDYQKCCIKNIRTTIPREGGR